MNVDTSTEKPFTVTFVDDGPNISLEISNNSDQPLDSIEVLTVFLKDDEAPTGPSRAHIRFEGLKRLQAKGKAVLSHKTWIDGKPAAPEQDKMELLRLTSGKLRSYVLDISWSDGDGKSRFQRIPVGH